MNLTSATAPGSVATDVLIDPSNPLVFYAGLVKANDKSQGWSVQERRWRRDLAIADQPPL